MASDRGDGAGAHSYELSANAERDVSEVVRCEELPAQWEKYPLKTQHEMLHGRRGLGRDEVRRAIISRWADEGEKWLRDRFQDNPDLEFHTSWSIDELNITLTVTRKVKRNFDNGLQTHFSEKLFEETCKAENFVSHLMVTKILMVM